MGEEADRIIDKKINNACAVGNTWPKSMREPINSCRVFDSEKVRGVAKILGQALSSGTRGDKIQVALKGYNGVYLMFAAGNIEAGNAICVSEDGRAVYSISKAASDSQRIALDKLFENQRSPEEIKRARLDETLNKKGEAYCQFCHKSGLHWSKDMGKLVLREPAGFIHDCGRSQVKINLPLLGK